MIDEKILIAIIMSVVASVSITSYIVNITPLQNSDFESHFKSPKYIPAGYTLNDSDIDRRYLALFYRPDNATDRSSHSLLYFVAGDDGDYYTNLISKGRAFLEEYKANSQRGDTMTIFEINGMPAMKWDRGSKNSVTMFDNGTLVSVEPLDYPAEVWMIDTEDRAFYTVRGYLPLDELIKMISSVG